MSPCCLGGWILAVAELDADMELARAAAAQATHRWGDVTQSSFRLHGARRRRGLVACAKLVGTTVATSASLFCIEVIDDGS
jgi:hypothetical protein